MRKRSPTRHAATARKNFAAFHARPVSKKSAIEFTMPRALTFLGQGFSVEYLSDKRNGPRNKTKTGKFKTNRYRHLFGPGVKIYLHPNKRWILIGGGKFRVTDWMRG